MLVAAALIMVLVLEVIVVMGGGRDGKEWMAIVSIVQAMLLALPLLQHTTILVFPIAMITITFTCNIIATTSAANYHDRLYHAC